MSGGALSCTLIFHTQRINLTTNCSSCVRGQQGREQCFPQALGEETLKELCGRHMKIRSLLSFFPIIANRHYFLETVACVLLCSRNIKAKVTDLLLPLTFDCTDPFCNQKGKIVQNLEIWFRFLSP